MLFIIKEGEYMSNKFDKLYQELIDWVNAPITYAERTS